ncbi:MAG: 2-succinyl-5-enolpyruvyl-6-hydroxy-3-cyclohexene-1-carboxylic-acid synthase [Ktedonobacterales bacterium]|nr:2-succinyl-5-enolpyruvyl-6-hydroxy-3-cyclohexene-1-carboxylic-acid synthase [Ktedonobacterales bacterium]
MIATDPLYAYVGAFVDELWRAGVTDVVICPGSRSTPLAFAFAARQQDIKVWMHVDERSAAFFALGLAKVKHVPVALVCTSGTAAANFFPAIAEANLTHVPLIVLTADRPPELRDNGAPQTIDQNRLYGTHVKWYSEAPLPDATPAAIRAIRTLADRAAATARIVPAGPVHLNMPFREPLVPSGEIPTQTPANLPENGLFRGGASMNAYALHAFPSVSEGIAGLMSDQQCGLIIVGAHNSEELPRQILALAKILDYPILADPLSHLRAWDDEHIITSYDAFLRDPHVVEAVEPHIILRFGAMPTAKPVLQYLQRYSGCHVIVVNGDGDWNDPTQLAGEMIFAEPTQFCAELFETIRTRKHQSNAPEQQNTWMACWRAAERVTKAALQSGIDAFNETFEGRVFTELAEILPDRATLFVGNSMPIRDCDTFFWGKPGVTIVGNRGANGIDGITSSALGVSAARGGNTVLVIGDLSFYHDMNGLLAAKLHDLDLTVVLINNDGGGIFSFLPQADYPEHFEQVFGTPTGLDFRPAVEMYGGRFTRPDNWADFRSALIRGMEEGGLHVVEVATDRARNVAMHRELWGLVHTALVERGVFTPVEDAAS